MFRGGSYGTANSRMLGTYRTGEACNGYLVKVGRLPVCWIAARGDVLPGKYTILEINLVMISHFHPDHYVDLYALRHLFRAARYQGKRWGRICSSPSILGAVSILRAPSLRYILYILQPGSSGLNIEFYPASIPAELQPQVLTGNASLLQQ